jgi:hypothetical protein
MIAINSKRIDLLFDIFKSDIDSQTEIVVENLKALRESISDKNQRAYVSALLRKKRNLIVASIDELETFKVEFDNIYEINPDNKIHRAFKNRVINALGYKDKRSGFYPKYFGKLGLKTCVYCNAQLCITVERRSGELSAKFQVDHFIRKDKYPCVSIALFNLYPVCGSCNNIKGVKDVPFKLYCKTNDPLTCDYKFILENPILTQGDYIANRNPDVIKIIFQEPPVPDGDNTMDDVFDISGIYKTQIDIVEELIMKAHIYNESYKQSLKDNFTSIFPQKNVIDRLIVGNYIDESEIHNRPMSKFMQDMAEQLKLI